MATRFLTLSRSFLSAAAKPHLSLSRPSLTSSPLLRLRPLAAVSAHLRLAPTIPSARTFATRQTSSSLNDPNPNWSNRPPKETILLDGCDFEHWLIVMEPPEGDMTRDDIIASYIKTLAQVVGSEEEARMKIYSVSTKHYFAFGALVSEELSYKMKELPGVRWVLPDSYLDVRNKDYGGEPFINGQAVPYDPKYHAEWVRNNARANERNRRNDRPRNNDRSRNFERRRENMQNQNQGYQSQGGPTSLPNVGPPPQNPNMGPPSQNPNMGPPSQYPNMGPPSQYPNMGPPTQNSNMRPNMGPNNPMQNMGPNNPMQNNMGPNNPMQNNMRPNMGPNNNMPNNMGGANMAPNNMGPNNMMPNNAGRAPQNMGYNNAPNNQYGGGPTNYGGAQYQDRDMRAPPQQSRDYLKNYEPEGAPAVNNSYQPQNVGGRDAPMPPNYQ